MKKLIALSTLVAALSLGACSKKTPANTPKAPDNTADTSGSGSEIGNTQDPSDMRPTGSPTPDNTEENRTGGSTQN